MMRSATETFGGACAVGLRHRRIIMLSQRLQTEPHWELGPGETNDWLTDIDQIRCVE